MAAYSGVTALQVVSPKGDDFQVVESTLKQILLESRVADTKVMVVSILGGSCKGRSFILNVFLRYLQNYGKENWMDVPGPVKGFKWGLSKEAKTMGLLLWPEPFIIKVPPRDEEVCILLMDSQGYPIEDIMNSEYLKIFSLSSKICSVQIYTIGDGYSMDLLYFKAALKGCEGNQIQRFYFLLQNWPRQDLYQYGLGDGQKYMDDRLKIKKHYSPVFVEASKYLTKKLKDKHCFILPHPGPHVPSSKFIGHLSDNGIAPAFKTNLKIFTELVLCPENVVVKEIGGRGVTGRLLFEYFKIYTEESNRVRHPRNVFQPPGAGDNVEAMRDAISVYRDEMFKVCGVGLQWKPCLSQKYLESHHDLSLELAVQKLRDIRNSKKLYGEHWLYEKKLRQEIMELYYDGYKSNLL